MNWSKIFKFNSNDTTSTQIIISDSKTTIKVNGKKIDPNSKEGRKILKNANIQTEEASDSMNKAFEAMDKAFAAMNKTFEEVFK